MKTRRRPEGDHRPTWHVVLTRPPAELPEVKRAFVVGTGAWDVTNRVIEAVRSRGWSAVLLEAEPGALCPRHPPQLVDGVCQDCGCAVCPTCRARARGADRCATCEARLLARRRTVRLRKLFFAFLLAAVVAESARWATRESEVVDATGAVRVAFVQLVHPDALGAPLVAEMDGGGIATIADWYAAERARYGGRGGRFVAADVLGPFVENVRPPLLPPREPTLLDQLRVAFGFPKYFHDLARQNGVDPDAYGARVYVVYGRGGSELAGDSRGSRTGRIAVSFVDVDGPLAYAQLTLAHELGHIFGADDLYREGDFVARFPEGYVQPWADPPYPQTYAELMAVDVPLSPTDEREVRSLDEVRVGYRTAAAFGWISDEKADAYYARGVFDADRRLGADIGESPDVALEPGPPLAPEPSIALEQVPTPG